MVASRSSLVLLPSLLCACASDPVPDDGDEAGPGDEGLTLAVDVSAGERTYVSLSPLEVVDTDGATTDWDLAFQGYGVYTNGGESGPGRGSAFGPLTAPNFLSDTAPSVPWLAVDKPGGAFLVWYKYDASNNHTLLSRFHVYALRDGDRLYKLQILSYYGERGGAPVSAIYSVRWAEVLDEGESEIQVAAELDGTSDEHECLNLESGARSRHTRESSQEDSDWHVCFFRDALRVNGGDGGPRGVEAVDLDAGETETETLPEIRARTAETELARFEAVDHARLTDPELLYLPDGVASAFAGRWIDDTNPPAPRDFVWLVVGPEGTKHLVTFDRFADATASAPGQIHLRAKVVR